MSELEQELAELRQIARIHAALPAFAAHVRPDGGFLGLNRFAGGFSRGDLHGKSLFDFTDPEHHATMRASLARVVASGQPHGFATVGAGHGGRPTRYYTRIAPIMRDGAVESLVVLATEITDAE